jgi:predicted TIM-barrel fold metal-dependent hydrolase
MRIIDAHTHPVFMHDGATPAAARRLVAHGRAHGIVKMVALGDVLVHGRLPSAAQCRRINDETAQLKRWHPDYFIGFCCLNPTLGARTVEREVERCVTQHGFRGIKLEISNNARDACMGAVMAAARRWNLVVLQHTWSQTNIHQRRFHSDPADTAWLARRHPDVSVIMAHLTGCGYRGVLEAKGLPNLFVDTSGAYPEAEILDFAVQELGAERILYGSDLPIRETSVTVGRVLGARLSAMQRRLILHDNAAKLFRL